MIEAALRAGKEKDPADAVKEKLKREIKNMKPVIAIHAGAGNLLRENFATDDIKNYRAGLKRAVEAGMAVLQNHGSAVDAVCAAVAELENNPLFNAGRGAVFTHAGTHEMDACVMRGTDRAAGAVACVSRIAHPVLAARAVMTEGEHVLLTGEGAEAFARDAGLTLVDDPSYFDTERRRLELNRALALEAQQGKRTTALSEDAFAQTLDQTAAGPDRKFGTVGAVACDADGHIAAATSTGGMTNKRCGRIGDSPIVGAGTFAEDETCAVSCTGHGEYFIRYEAAGDIAARMRYLGESLETAAQTVIGNLAEKGGRGGLVAVDREGNVTFAINSAGMYRARLSAGEKPEMAIFADEPLSEGG